MKKTAVLVEFAKQPEGQNDGIFDAFFEALRGLQVDGHLAISFKDYDDEHVSPVIYFP